MLKHLILRNKIAQAVLQNILLARCILNDTCINDRSSDALKHQYCQVCHGTEHKIDLGSYLSRDFASIRVLPPQ